MNGVWRLRRRLIALALVAAACGGGGPVASPDPTDAPTSSAGPSESSAPTEPSESAAPSEAPTAAEGTITTDFSDATGWDTVQEAGLAIGVADGALRFDLIEDGSAFAGIPGMPAVVSGTTHVEVDVERVDDGAELSSAGIQCWVRSAQLDYFFYGQVTSDGRYALGRFTEAGREDLVLAEVAAPSFNEGEPNRIALDCIDEEGAPTLVLSINGEEADRVAVDTEAGGEVWSHGYVRLFTQGGPAEWTYDDLSVTAPPRESLDGLASSATCPAGDTTDDKGNPIAPPYPGSDIVSAAISVDAGQLALVIQTVDDIQQDFEPDPDAGPQGQRFVYGAELRWGDLGRNRFSYEAVLVPSYSEDGEPGWHDNWYSRLDDISVDGAPTVEGDTLTSVVDITAIPLDAPFTWSVYVHDRAIRGDSCPPSGEDDATFPS